MTTLSSFFATSDSGIPVGSLVAGPALNPFPANYLPCDGKISYANSSYPLISPYMLPVYSWQATTMGTSQAWNAVIYGGSTWLAFGSASRTTYTSSDGINWTAHTNALPATGYIIVAWNGSVFCAVAAGTAAATSSDGVSWTLRTLPSANFTWNSIVWNGTYFIISSSTAPVVTTSTDGTTWSALKPVTAYSGRALAAMATANPTSGQVISSVAAVNGSDPVFSTTDTINWVAVPATFSNSVNAGIPIWNGTLWLMFAKNAASSYMTSKDGLSWVGRHLTIVGTGGPGIATAAAALSVGVTAVGPVTQSGAGQAICMVASDGIFNSAYLLQTVTTSATLASNISLLASDGTNFVALCGAGGSTSVAFYGTYDSSHFYTPNLSYAGSYYIKAS